VLEMNSRSIPKQMLFNRLMGIAVGEGYQPSIEGVKRIVKVCPTVRSCIKTLQLCCTNDNWKAIYPRDVDGSVETRFLNMFHGKLEAVPTKETYRLMDYALANGVPLKQITQMNTLSMMRRKIAGFRVHESFALCMQNPSLENLVKPKYFEKKNNKGQKDKRKKIEEQKRKVLMKKLNTKPAKAKEKQTSKPKKKKTQAVIDSGWDDLF